MQAVHCHHQAAVKPFRKYMAQPLLKILPEYEHVSYYCTVSARIDIGSILLMTRLAFFIIAFLF